MDLNITFSFHISLAIFLEPTNFHNHFLPLKDRFYLINLRNNLKFLRNILDSEIIFNYWIP